MFSHVTIGTTDVERAEVFYTAVLAPLGLVLRHREPVLARFGRVGEELPFFTVLKPFNDEQASVGNGTMVAFVAENRAAVRSVHGNALEKGGTCDGPPGLRPDYGAGYYGAYFRDPDGNKLHVVFRAPQSAE